MEHNPVMTDRQHGDAAPGAAEAARPGEALARPRVEALDALLGRAIPVLDHGFVRVIDYMGDDAAVVQAARVSYGRGTRTARDDAGLIRYLMRHWHSTPFEMCELKLHVKLPIFVARQWIRHRTANVNEISARYSILDREFYVPAPEHMAVQSATNRQGRGAVLEAEAAGAVRAVMAEEAGRAYDRYEELMDGEAGPGLARELARMTLPASIYTQWYWKTDLHNLLHFLRLRADAHAQYEIRAYAEAIGGIVEAWVPATWAAFRDHRLEAVQFSAPAMACLRRMLAGEAVTEATSGLSAGEWREFQAALAG
ncbi:MAG: FAD-dependent thymidylate synthase [Pseudomonadota bacterium]